MAFVYIVRCRFTEPAKEQAWNAWYSGPKIAQMLRKPHFRTCQRFARTSGMGRNYLALWVLRSPDAFKTEQYTTDWGFFEWAPYITDWSRDLFDGGDAPEADFAVPAQGALDVVSFDGMTADEVNDARPAMATIAPGHDVAAGHRPRPAHPDDRTSRVARANGGGTGRRRPGAHSGGDLPPDLRLRHRRVTEGLHLRLRPNRHACRAGPIGLENTTATCHVQPVGTKA